MKKSSPSLTFMSGVGSVTGANFLMDVPLGFKILIDCGLIQGEKVAMEENNKPFAYNPWEIGALMVTHAHLDHVGRIPKLVKEGFVGPIYSTPETRDLAELVLKDAVGILSSEALQQSREPLYTIDDVSRVFPLWKTIQYHENFSVCEDVDVYLKDAGHILGSAMIEMSVKFNSGDRKMKILFTGDLGNAPAPILKENEPIGNVDYVVIESVYGDRNHEPKEERTAKFEKVIKKSIEKGGTLVIPAFSIDRTQVLLFELNNLVEQGRIPSVPVFVDSPMAITATQIYKSSPNLFNDKVREQIKNGDSIFSFPRLEYTTSTSESNNIERIRGAKIILAGSGMSVGGRVINHEMNYLPDSRNTILLVGYQTAGSLGRQLADGVKKVKIRDEQIEVKAEIETLYGYSAHMDSDHLVGFISDAGSNLKKVFVAMGEPKSSMHLAQRINDELGTKAIVPEIGTKYSL